MVVGVTSIFIVSFLFAPRRGAMARVVRHRRFRRKTATENILRTMYKFGEPARDWHEPRSLGELLQHRDMPMGFLQRTIRRLDHDGLVREGSDGRFVLTEAGIREAERVTRLHRLWELYLMKKLEIAPDHVHDDAEEIEHILTPELEQRLLDELEGEDLDPHGQQIPAPVQEGQPR
jgi:manganese/zinc/iron transport system permease protein